jgi:uncharacterized membrane protein YphA (DoxX/SURF4 family)
VDVLFLIGRVLFALVFVSSGFMAHLGEGGKMGRQYARSLGAPNPDLLVPLSGIAIIAGGLMIALGIWADLGALLIIGFLAGITPIMHAFWKVEGRPGAAGGPSSAEPDGAPVNGVIRHASGAIIGSACPASCSSTARSWARSPGRW